MIKKHFDNVIYLVIFFGWKKRNFYIKEIWFVIVALKSDLLRFWELHKKMIRGNVELY